MSVSTPTKKTKSKKISADELIKELKNDERFKELSGDQYEKVIFYIQEKNKSLEEENEKDEGTPQKGEKMILEIMRLVDMVDIKKYQTYTVLTKSIDMIDKIEDDNNLTHMFLDIEFVLKRDNIRQLHLKMLQGKIIEKLKKNEIFVSDLYKKIDINARTAQRLSSFYYLVAKIPVLLFVGLSFSDLSNNAKKILLEYEKRDEFYTKMNHTVTEEFLVSMYEKNLDISKNVVATEQNVEEYLNTEYLCNNFMEE
jgi:hypothetical protein